MPKISLVRRRHDIPLFVADVMAFADSEQIFYYRNETSKSVSFHFKTQGDRDRVSEFLDYTHYQQTVF